MTRPTNSTLKLPSNWQDWPDTLKRQFLERLRTLDNPTSLSQAATPEARLVEMDRCQKDMIYWVNAYCRTYDPREKPADLPFKLFPKQATLLRWIEERENHRQSGLIEKSRDAGVTWLCCAFALHRWLFRPGYLVGFGSRKLELVDRIGDISCIFEKLRFILDRLPDWMRPEGFDRLRHDNYAKLINPANGSSIIGEGGANIGRGGRASIVFLDEAAYLDNPESVDRALAATTDVRIDVSTPNGSGNPFATKRFSGTLPVFTLSWRDDPRKTEAWAQARQAILDPIVWQQEYEISYSAAQQGTLIPSEWVRAAVDFPLEPVGEPIFGFDISERGKNLCVLLGRRGGVILPSISWGHENTTTTAWKARDHINNLQGTVAHYDANGVGAGVKGTWDTSELPLGFRAHPLYTGESATELEWPDGKKSREKFLNLRAELWWLLRVRFEKTYEVARGLASHPPEQLISIPNEARLIGELSLPLYFHTDAGKIKVESKAAMKTRGIPSPDFADALTYAFYPEDDEDWYEPGMMTGSY